MPILDFCGREKLFHRIVLTQKILRMDLSQNGRIGCSHERLAN